MSAYIHHKEDKVNKKGAKKTTKKALPKVGLFWHCHHNILLEYVYNSKSRLEAIKDKPSYQVKTRLKLFKPADISKLPKAVRDAYAGIKEYQVLDAKADAASNTFDKAGGAADTTIGKMSDALDRVEQAVRYHRIKVADARAKLDLAIDAALKAQGVAKAAQAVLNSANKAREASAKTEQSIYAAIVNNKAAIEKAHKEQCGCKEWDGTEITYPSGY